MAGGSAGGGNGSGNTLRVRNGAASRNEQLVVVGLEGTILRSQVVPDLTPVNFIAFNRVAGFNVFLVEGQTDQQFTLDSSTNLVKWTTGPLLEILSSSGTLEFIMRSTRSRVGGFGGL